jgi:hypothetical protein
MIPEVSEQQYRTPSWTGTEEELIRYTNLKLAVLGQPVNKSTMNPAALELAGPLLRNFYQKDTWLGGRLCPVDERIQRYLDAYLTAVCPAGVPRLPWDTLILDRAGMARLMSLPLDSDYHASPFLQSYRVAQGVLHNPRSERRTTKGIFHIVEGGFPVPDDKIEVPRSAFAALLAKAFCPPPNLLRLPFTAGQDPEARLFVSLLLRPLVCPETAVDPAKSMEIRFFAPASLVSNLDFVECIFGNGGDPYLPENDAALDVLHWTGHTGCVILAPHLAGIEKRELGLPHVDQATERQRRDGMCWTHEDEKYNSGNAFKVACRDDRGVMVTIIADNYYGYCKKEVKTQISFAANLYGLSEEEHAGGAIVAAAYSLGHEFCATMLSAIPRVPFEQALRLLGGRAKLLPEGYAVDTTYPEILYVPGDTRFSVREGKVSWTDGQGDHAIPLSPGNMYVLPSGYRVRIDKRAGDSSWNLIGSIAQGMLCHKPCTVSGGGKSEISKSITESLIKGPVFVGDFQNDMEQVAAILARDYSEVHRLPNSERRAGRPILSPERSLGSVIKLLTPSSALTDEHQAWLRSLPETVRQLVFTVKRYYNSEWRDDWARHFSVDRINGRPGHELRFEGKKLVANYLRVGFESDGSWRIFKLRADFYPAQKLQVEDDITASVVVPKESLTGVGFLPNPSLKLVGNCEQMLFQRPDDAVHRGADFQAEADIATSGVFLSNFEPLTKEDARQLMEQIAEFDQYTGPMRQLIRSFAERPSPDYFVSSAHPRLVDDLPSKNQRYLQKRPDLVRPAAYYLASVCARLDRSIPAESPVHFPVHEVLAGRRNSPADPAAGLPPLAVYNPIHYQEIPELFMDFVSSLTGKSPSTTGFGSEGALTKGPFNALWPVVDLNNALVSAIITQYPGYTTAAGHIGPQFRVDHDISMLVPEVWCRMRNAERDPKFLIENGFLEKLENFDLDGRRVLASRLGYRITEQFAEEFLGRIFEMPGSVFTQEILRPEKQDMKSFAEGVDAIVESQRSVALHYFADGSVDAACPPLKALLHIMVHGSFEGLKIDSPELRRMFTRDSVLASDWYAERLRVRQVRDVALWQRHIAALESFQAAGERAHPAQCLDSKGLLDAARRQLARVSAPGYLSELSGTLGADPFHMQMPAARVAGQR